jgi:hypothetical protein
MLIVSLSVPFEQNLHDLLLERLEKSSNEKALTFIAKFDVATSGVLCTTCNTTKPVYCYGQGTGSKYGFTFDKCIACRNKAKCPYSRMVESTRSGSKTRSHDPPSFGVVYLKKLYIKQDGRCFISGWKMLEKRGDHDPYNFSVERLNNQICYTQENVVLICQCFQISTGDYLPHEIRSWFEYNSECDGFVFDVDFTEQPNKKRRDRVTPIKTYDEAGAMISKTCTDCGVDKEVSCFTKVKGGTKSFCKPCAVVRATQRQNKSPHGFMKKMADCARGSTKRRGTKRSRNDESGVCDDDLLSLFVSVIKRQGGRCAVTGIPFVYQKSHRFSPSPDRLINAKGYIQGNVEMIIAPLNTQNKPSNAEFRAMMKNNK